MVRASEKVRAKKIMPRACPSFQKAWLDRAELLKTPGSRALIRAEPRIDPALVVMHKFPRKNYVNEKLNWTMDQTKKACKWNFT